MTTSDGLPPLTARQRLVDALLDFTDTTPAQLARELDLAMATGTYFLGRLEDTSHQQQLHALIKAGFLATESDRFLDALVGVFTATHSGIPLRRLESAVDRMSLHEQMTAQQRATLTAILTGPQATVPATTLAEVIRALAPVPPAVERAPDVLAAIRALEQAAATTALPPVLRFVEHLAARVGPVRQALRSWADAYWYGREPDLRQAQLDLRDQLDRCPTPAMIRWYATVDVEERAGVHGPVFVLSCWLSDGTGSVSHKYGDPREWAAAAIRAAGEQHLAALAGFLAETDGEDVMIEFMLPSSLLDRGVERWRVAGTRIGTQVPVVVRPRERLLLSLSFGPWRRRSAGLAPLDRQSDRQSDRQPDRPDRPDRPDLPVAMVRWLRRSSTDDPTGAQLDDDIEVDSPDHDVLKSTLDGFQHLCCLGLVNGPVTATTAPTVAVTAAVAAGVPAVLWRPDQGDVADLRTLLDKLAASGRLDQLPRDVLRLRQAADATDRADHPGHHITIIWDGHGRLAATRAARRALVAPQQAGATR